jgi:2-polyprenyl-6-methoxyphenol hydroxylase-like FAD-dependent oxidoreductase
VCIRSLRA